MSKIGAVVRPPQDGSPTPDIAFICTALASYTRNETLLAALAEHYRVRAISSDRTTYPSRMLSVMPRALASVRTSDVLVLGFLAQPLVPLLPLRRASSPIVVDAFISLYETLCEDRQAMSKKNPVAKLARWLDGAVMRRADRILVDTNANARYLSDVYGIDLRKFATVYVGANEKLFYPRLRQSASEEFLVFYYSTFLPLHGVDVVVRAAALLVDKRPIRFHIVGDGPERRRVGALASELGVTNVVFQDPVPFAALPTHIAQADVCLAGHFNARNAKAQRVVPGKAFQFLAMARPVIAGDCPGVREALVNDVDALLIPMGDSHALAEAILRLKGDQEYRQRIAVSGLRRFRRDFSLSVNADRVKAVIDSISDGVLRHASAA